MRRPGVRAQAALLAAGGVAISAFTIRRGLDPFDEGLMLQAARRVSQGELPYRDFLWPYGPGQPMLLAGLFEAFGASALSWRFVRVLANAAVSLAVWGIARREAPPWLALLAWLASACAMAEPTGPAAFPAALAFSLGAVLVAGRARDGVAVASPTHNRALAAGALTGLAAAWRLDFGIYAGAAVLVGWLAGAGDRRARLRAAGAYAATAAGSTLLVYLPFAIAAGPGRLYDRLAGSSLREREWWTLPFPLDYDGPLRSWPPGALASDARDLLHFYVPGLLVAGMALAAVVLARRAWRERRAPDPLALSLLTLAAGGLSYLLSRTDVAHAMAVVPFVAVLAAVVVGPRARAAGGRAVALRLGVAEIALVAVLALVAVDVVANRVSALVLPPAMEAVDAPAADGVRAPPGEARALSRIVAEIQARVPPDEPIYVAPRRSDLIALNNPLLYVLADRDNASGEDFGLLAGAAAQRRIVARLRRASPRVVVRWTDPASSRPEPNRRGRSSGVRTLDDHLAREYRLEARHGHYELLVPR